MEKQESRGFRDRDSGDDGKTMIVNREQKSDGFPHLFVMRVYWKALRGKHGSPPQINHRRSGPEG